MDLYSHYLMDGRWDFARPLGEAPRRGVEVAICDTGDKILVGFRGKWWAYDEFKKRAIFKRLSSRTRQWVKDRIDSIETRAIPQGGGPTAFDREMFEQVEAELEAEDKGK